MEAHITSLGGKVTRSLKTAHILVCEDLWGDKAMDAMNKYDRIDDGRTKEDVLIALEEFAMLPPTLPTLQVGKKSIIVNSEWFTEKGVPLVLKDRTMQDTPCTMQYEGDGEEFPYDCCFHQDGNVEDQYTQLTRLQLLQEDSSGSFVLINKSAFLADLMSSGPATSYCSRFDDLAEAVTSFQNSFKESVGYTWKNRATCKPKKGAALAVDLETLGNK
jgi:hypothetical protein